MQPLYSTHHSFVRAIPPMLGLVLVLLLTGCGSPAAATMAVATATTAAPSATAATPPTATIAPPTPTIAPPIPTKTPAGPMWCDSIWRVEANAWLDINGDGQRDADEGPLPDAKFDIASYSYSGVSDGTGRAVFRILSGCTSPTFSVTATPPPGYRLTTSARVDVKGEGKANFGFAPE